MIKRYIDFINESVADGNRLAEYDQISPLSTVKDMTYELVEYFNEDLDGEDFQEVGDVVYGYLAYGETFDWYSIPEQLSEDVNLYSTGFSDSYRLGWYMSFVTPDTWIASTGAGVLTNSPLVSDKRFNMLNKIKQKAKEAGFDLLIFQRQRDYKLYNFLLFISDIEVANTTHSNIVVDEISHKTKLKK